MKGLIYSSKYKFIALLLIATAAIALATSSTIAFFTDAKESTGVFTAGNVYIELTEAAVMRNSIGDLVEDASQPRVMGSALNSPDPATVHDYGVLFPGQVIHKDPTVKNVGADNAWIAVKVIIEDGGGDIYKLFGYDNGTEDIDIELLLSGGLLDEKIHVSDWMGFNGVCHNDNYAMIQSADRHAGRYEFYFFIRNAVAPGEEVEIFNKLNVNPYFGNTEMEEFRELKVIVQAFAVQQYGFENCPEAMLEAFSSHFAPFINIEGE